MGLEKCRFARDTERLAGRRPASGLGRKARPHSELSEAERRVRWTYAILERQPPRNITARQIQVSQTSGESLLRERE